jgi:methyl-accepting chemotaxis protein
VARLLRHQCAVKKTPTTADKPMYWCLAAAPFVRAAPNSAHSKQPETSPMLKHLTIATRLKFTLGLLAALLLGLGGLALWQMNLMRDSAKEISETWLPSVELVGQLDIMATNLRVAEYAHVISHNDQAMTVIEKDITALRAQFDQTHAAYQKLINSDEERKLHDRFVAEWKQFLVLHDRLMAMSREFDADRARALIEGEGKQSFDRLSATLGQLVKLNHDGSMRESQASESVYASARIILLAGGAAGLLIAVCAAVWLVRAITGPLGQALAAAQRVASGDLGGHIDASGQDEAGQLLQALAEMQANLGRVVANVRQNAESVAAASAQIAQGNQDLSGRTEAQAGALQKTSATMNGLGTAVRHNTDSATQANQLAQGASAVAAQGGEVVSKVVATMQGINESSRRIGDIIGTIDGIAFQTNILALNAAVEAARAGEQGRGFAVVASEVRSLAQRSAEAAKEIKSLIGRSVEQVEQGTVLVDQAGKTMGEIVSAIQRVSDIVGEISTASTEQSTGVQLVGQAIDQMDQTTQQNAALVEQSAAAAESLRTQARGLVDAVSVFRLSANGMASPEAKAVASRPAAPAPRAVAPAAAQVSASAPARAEARTADEDWTSF